MIASAHAVGSRACCPAGASSFRTTVRIASFTVMKDLPSAYTSGYAKARRLDREAADNYVRHTRVGDPELDPVLEELAEVPPQDLHRFIRGGIEQREDLLREAPQALREFFDSIEEPAWFDRDAARAGVRVFHKNADLMLAAFVTAVLVEGFSTLIAKSFRITGRVAATKRRLQQNNRQLLDIFLPGGLDREGDGWKLSTRVRFVHARMRQLLAKSDSWDHGHWGTPLSAANMGLAISIFSERLLHYSSLLGASFKGDEKAGVLAVWRYTGYLMGIPESILYTDGASARRIHTVGFVCEPAADDDSAAMANALIQAIPDVASITDPAEKANTLTLAYRLSRALIGKKLADSYDYPTHGTWGTLYLFRTKQRLQKLLSRDSIIRSGNFSQMLQISAYDDEGFSYKLPDHVLASKQTPW